MGLAVRMHVLNESCVQCHTASQRQHFCVYNFACVHCCSRLVLTTRPDRDKAAAMLEAIARFERAPPRSEIIGLLSAHTSARP